MWVEQTEAIASRKQIRTHILKVAAILTQGRHTSVHTSMEITHSSMAKKKLNSH